MRRSIQRATSARGATATRTDEHGTNPQLDLLASGELEIVGRLTDASNATFLCDVTTKTGDPARAVYKPTRGERPLDDFPYGTLANREAAAYLLSQQLGWDIVPPTVIRGGPYGAGMVQLWIEVDQEVDVLALVIADDPRLRQMCIFDILANNADRKGGHILPTADGHLYGVDHGICFAVEPKLRTILWAWRGTNLEPDELAVVKQVCDALDGQLGVELGNLLSAAEVRATQQRADGLLRSGRFPQPDPTRPAIPWPPF